MQQSIYIPQNAKHPRPGFGMGMTRISFYSSSGTTSHTMGSSQS